MQSLLSVLKEGVIESNPVFVQVLGTCPALAVTTSAKNAFGMGLAVIFVLMGSNLLISLLRRFIPSQIRIASYIVVISTFVTVIEMLIETYIPGLYNSLGIFLPLIVVNCIVLARAEAYASKNPPLLALLDGFAMGVGFTVALVLLGGIREILGAGTLFEHNLFGEGFKPATLFVKPAGAFIIFGFLMAGVAKLRSYINGKKRNKNDKKEAAAL
ncbi:MAG: electron transport complex subunit E [Clostridiales bacterium]|nr:electron transport complex subunit E [Clostridiales bacterium]